MALIEQINSILRRILNEINEKQHCAWVSIQLLAINQKAEKKQNMFYALTLFRKTNISLFMRTYLIQFFFVLVCRIL